MYELLYVVRGRGTCFVEGTEYPLCDSSVLLLRPAEYHYVRPEAGVPYERIVLNFKEDVIGSLSEALPFLNRSKKPGDGVYFPPQVISPALLSAFGRLYPSELRDAAVPGDDARVAALLCTVTKEILLLLSFAEPHTAGGTQNRLINDVLRYLNENLSDEISLEDTARHFFVSKYYLCHAFQRYTGVSFTHYLGAKRIAAAERLMANGSSAGEAAFLVGFRDYSVFYRAFRRHTGGSPRSKNAK